MRKLLLLIVSIGALLAQDLSEKKMINANVAFQASTDEGRDQSTMYLSGAYGVFLNDNILVGGMLSFMREAQTTSIYRSAIQFGPLLRAYIDNGSNKLPFFEVSYQFGFLDSSAQSGSYSTTLLTLATGVDIMFSESVALEGKLAYDIRGYEGTSSNLTDIKVLFGFNVFL